MKVLAKIAGIIVAVIFLVSIGMNIFLIIGGGDLLSGFSDELVPKSPLIQVPVTASVLESLGGTSETKTLNNAGVSDIKVALAQGYRVIALLDNAVLSNPFYSSREKLYVELVGYTETHFIAKNGGIKSGEQFVYLIDDYIKALTAAGGQVVMVR